MAKSTDLDSKKKDSSDQSNTAQAQLTGHAALPQTQEALNQRLQAQLHEIVGDRLAEYIFREHQNAPELDAPRIIELLQRANSLLELNHGSNYGENPARWDLHMVHYFFNQAVKEELPPSQAWHHITTGKPFNEGDDCTDRMSRLQRTFETRLRPPLLGLSLNIEL